MAAATLGKIDEFDSSKEEWPQYVERLGHFFTANDIKTAEKKRAVFLAVIGPVTYRLLHNLISPAKPGDKTYQELVTTLTKHFNPTPSETVQRFKFNTRTRKPGESVSTYLAELRSLAEYCNYGASLEAMLRDRLVCGINNEKIQQRLLAEAKLTYAKALELAQGLETAAQNMKELGTSKGKEEPGNNASTIHTVGTASNGKVTCYRCGKAGHNAAVCRHKDTVCHGCGKRGHLKRACRSKQKGAAPSRTGQRKKSTRAVNKVDESEPEDGENELPLYHVTSGEQTRPLKISVQIEDQSVPMEIDTGAGLSLVSEATYREKWPDKPLEQSSKKLYSYSGEAIPVLGSMTVGVTYKSQVATLPLLVVKGEGPSLFGRNWLNHIRLDWHELYNMHASPLQATLQKHAAVFQDGLGTLQGFKAKIFVEEGATPRFCKARTVPYALKDLVDKELDRLVAEGTLEPVQFSDWASPIVPVLKADKSSVRVCGDFKQTVNPVSKLYRYPIPRIKDLFAKVAGGKSFSKIDLSHAYQQLVLDDESKQYVVISTQKGLFRYTRLPFGISSAPGIFQRVMESMLHDIPNVVVYIDDILITGASEEEHLETIESVLERLETAGLRAKKHKCKFMVPSVEYVGYKIDAKGLHPLPEKVRAVKEAPSPRSVQELKAYLGLLTYYSDFLPNMSSVLAPLYRLLRKDVSWQWTQVEEEAFEESKTLLTSESLLVHFDPSLPLTLACDASAYGVGAVLAHKMPDGTERPIGYASRSLTSAERNYSQLEKEGLSCIFGIKKFHSYLFGHHFELVTDHKPLLALLNEHRSTSPQASARIRRWSLFLSGYEYTLKFRKTTAHANTDALSRLPLTIEKPANQTPPELVLLLEHLSESPVTHQHIKTWTRRDPQLALIQQYLRSGWPNHCSPNLQPYESRKDELSSLDGCIVWGTRVVIPPQGRVAVLQELHSGHPGMARMKSLARMYVWWPGMDKDIETSVSTCQNCQLQQAKPPVAPLHPWKWPSRPWTRLHIDFAGPMNGKMYLVIIDAHSKWIEAFITNSSTSTTVIEILRHVFARFGLPEMIVSDNGPCFVSEEFESFLLANGVKHITSSPYHPATNGLAERAVQILKKGLKKVTTGSLQTRLAQVLMSYRITPQTTTGASPSELLMGRQPRTRLDLLKPNPESLVENKQMKQKVAHDKKARERTFAKGERVYARNFGTGNTWIPGEITESSGPVSFMVKCGDGKLIRRHQDHLRHRRDEQALEQSNETSDDAWIDVSSNDDTPENAETSDENAEIAQPEAEPQSTPRVEANTEQSTRKQYPTRERRPPDRL